MKSRHIGTISVKNPIHAERHVLQSAESTITQLALLNVRSLPQRASPNKKTVICFGAGQTKQEMTRRTETEKKHEVDSTVGSNSGKLTCEMNSPKLLKVPMKSTYLTYVPSIRLKSGNNTVL